MLIRGARCALGPRKTVRASIEIVNGRIARILNDSSPLRAARSDCHAIDLRGFLIVPGLINAHDHLDFSLFPRMANPPYRNYIEWGEDIHNKFPDVIAKHRAVPKDVRLWWGGIRNLLCGATTVSHHNPLWPVLQQKEFPVRVVQKYGWGHSLALGGDLRAARSATPEGRCFIVHACEGVDRESREELWGLYRLGVLDANTVLVHGLAMDREGIALMRKRGASLIVCPSSNNFLFGKLPDMSLLANIDNVALGSDSPLTGEGDLLDEARFAIRYCGILPESAYRMVTETSAAILRLENAEGSIKMSGVGDLIAVRDIGHDPGDILRTLSMVDVEFVTIGGQVQLASKSILERLAPAEKQGLEPLWIDGMVRWLRAPVNRLLRETEAVLGKDQIQLGSKQVHIPKSGQAL